MANITLSPQYHLVEDNFYGSFYPPVIRTTKTYVNANGEKVARLELETRMPRAKHMKIPFNHNYSLVMMETPWKTLPIISDNEILQIEPITAKIIYIPQREKIVMEVLQDPKITERLHQCSEMEKYFSDREEFEIEEEYLVQPYFCFTGAMFITGLWMLDNPFDERILKSDVESRIEDQLVQISPHQLKFMYGVFLFETNNTLEDHQFVLYMTTDKIKIYNTYGGCFGFNIKEFDRDEWINMFINFNELPGEEKMRTYFRLWAFSPECERVSEREYKVEGLQTVSVKTLLAARIW